MSSNHSWNYTLPHRIAGLHPFGGNEGFQQIKQNFALFVIDMENEQYVTAATALPSHYFDTMALMNSQATQVSIPLGGCRIFWGGHKQATHFSH